MATASNAAADGRSGGVVIGVAISFDVPTRGFKDSVANTIGLLASLIKQESYSGLGPVRIGVDILEEISEFLEHAIQKGALGDSPLLRSTLKQWQDGLTVLNAEGHPLRKMSLLVNLLHGWLRRVAPQAFSEAMPSSTCLTSDEDGKILIDAETSHWIAAGLHVMSTVIRDIFNPQDPSQVQRDILLALDGRTMKARELAKEVFGRASNTNMLYRKRGIDELIDHGLVKLSSNVGYYRPDSLPDV